MVSSREDGSHAVDHLSAEELNEVITVYRTTHVVTEHRWEILSTIYFAVFILISKFLIRN